MLANEQKIDRFAGDLCSALVSANSIKKLALIFFAVAATVMADDSAPAKMQIHAKAIPVLLATRADCASQVQSTQKGQLATFTLPSEPGYECTEDIQTFQAERKIKAITTAELASKSDAVLIRHTYVSR